MSDTKTGGTGTGGTSGDGIHRGDLPPATPADTAAGGADSSTGGTPATDPGIHRG